ncbi:hypothetical protein H0264_28880 [Nocardia huaxiensis]|uniref:Uncharacterized protein n=1 Tax=Nocardia huaxiensis TaxID=2755382 RepID=A0A7D6ZMG4_9NOCA|nr:hypothetical protein [Nocardia huaxiensis]QLY29265.1 hypothetical protein H0264_28880 [Nocardia huaxiensis]
MDPNAALDQIRGLTDEAYALSPYIDHDQNEEARLLYALVEAVVGLDSWLSRGEVLPEWWAHGVGRA